MTEIDYKNLPMLRTSERKDFKRCPQRWYWAWVERLRKRGNPSNPLWFGTGMHLAFENWYIEGRERGIPLKETWLKYCADSAGEVTWFTGDDGEAELEDSQDLGSLIIDAYMEAYGEEKHIEVLQTERSSEVIIPGADGQPAVLYCYTLDSVWRDHSDNGMVKIVDHKNVGQISTKHLTLDDQAGSYWAISTQQLRSDGIIGPKENIKGIIYNFVRKGKPDERPTNEKGQSLNQNGSVSKRQPSPLFVRYFVPRSPRERASQIRRIVDELQWMEAAKSGLLPLYKTPTKDCSWDCQFFSMCESHESSPDWKDYKKHMFEVSDPYVNHRDKDYGS